MSEQNIKVIRKDKQKKELNINYRRENHFWCSYKVLDKDFYDWIDCRFYCTNGGTVTCCIWVSGENNFRASGKAGGWGYEKKSAALQDALNNAGIVLNKSIWGTGEIRDTLTAVGKWTSKKRNLHVIEAFG